MRTYRPWLVGILFLATFAAAGYGLVTGINGFGDLMELGPALDARDGETRRGQELDGLRQSLDAYLRARREVLRQVADEALSLLEAAARFRDLDRGPHGKTGRRCLRYYFGGHTDEERYCRMVIALVREEGWSRTLLERLEEELNEYLSR
jgi:hypothetical protein